MVALLPLLLIVVAGFGFLLGYAIGASGEAETRRRSAGLTKQSARLYREAAKILNRLINLTDLDDQLAADIVSPETRKRIEQWLDDYRKQVNS